MHETSITNLNNSIFSYCEIICCFARVIKELYFFKFRTLQCWANKCQRLKLPVPFMKTLGKLVALLVLMQQIYESRYFVP